MLAAVSARADDESEAERLFREGRALMLEDRFAEACPKIEESNRIEPRVGTLLNLAACHERQGRTASAWIEYQKVLTAARVEGRTDREKIAQERIAVLEPRVPWLKLAVTQGDAERLELTLDGAVIAPAAWGKEMPVDPGAHVVAASSDAGPFEERFELGESERRTIVVAPGPNPAPGGKAPVLVVEPKPKSAPVAPVSDTGTTRRTIGFVTGGLGIAALGVAAAFAVRKSELKDELGASANGTGVSSRELEILDDMKTSSTITDVAAIGGLVALGTGIVLVLTSGSSTSASKASTRSVPPMRVLATPRTFALQGSF